MYRLIDKNTCPPKGFQWVDPITTQEASARSYQNWMSAANDIRVGNGNPLADPAEMEDQLCRRYDEKTRKHYCYEVQDSGEPKKLGVGSTLKSMLAAIGISTCWGCVNLAQRMDDWGPDGCEEHMAEIIAVMEQNAQQRNWMRFIPFREQGSRMLVRIAIDKVRADQS